MNACGILSLNKPPGLTSRDAVDRVQRLLRPAKCGHAGTLDPLATGVLVVCVGPATRLIQYVQRMEKRYRATFLLGRRSASDDVEREVEVLPDQREPTEVELLAAMRQFVGQIEQRPPAHSAIKVGGQRAYKLARRGEPLELPARTVTIHALELVRYVYPELVVDVRCGSGTYVRSLGRDLAESLGTAGVMSALERTAIGGFHIERAAAVDSLSEANWPQHLQPALAAVADLPRVAVDAQQLVELRHGRPIARPVAESAAESATLSGTEADPSAASPAAEWAALDDAASLVAILYEKRPGELWPRYNLV